jgi:hypothetical protein
MSLKNLYHGDIDGLCGQETVNALKQFSNTLNNAQRETFSLSCSQDTRDKLQDYMRLSLNTKPNVAALEIGKFRICC